MGGIGSGRFPERADAPRQDPEPDVTTAELRKRGVFDTEEEVHWNRISHSGQFTRIGAGIRDDKLVLVFGTAKKGQPHIVNLSVDLSWSDCNLGGKRPWFLCPGRFEKPCGKRVAKLYLDGEFLVCRHCLGFRYVSDHPDPMFRALHRAQKLLRDLGGSGSLLEDFPPRPRYMRFGRYFLRYKQVKGIVDDFSVEGRYVYRKTVGPTAEGEDYDAGEGLDGEGVAGEDVGLPPDEAES